MLLVDGINSGVLRHQQRWRHVVMTTTHRLHLNDVSTSMLARLQMLEALRLQLIAKPRRGVDDGFGTAQYGRCDRGHAHTCIGSLAHLVAFTPALALLCSPVLKPDLDLSVGQPDWSGQFGLALYRYVLVEQKFFLELDFLLLRVHYAIFLLSPRLVSCTRHRTMFSSPANTCTVGQ